MPDREKYIEVLSKTAKTVKEFNEDAPIKISLECIEDILELLKEHEARWISIPHKRARICSHCEADEPYKFADDDAEVYEYCPHCGAKMTEGR